MIDRIDCRIGCNSRRGTKGMCQSQRWSRTRSRAKALRKRKRIVRIGKLTNADPHWNKVVEDAIAATHHKLVIGGNAIGEAKTWANVCKVCIEHLVSPADSLRCGIWILA